jgi:hypothetical protein
LTWEAVKGHLSGAQTGRYEFRDFGGAANRVAANGLISWQRQALPGKRFAYKRCQVKDGAAVVSGQTFEDIDLMSPSLRMNFTWQK